MKGALIVLFFFAVVKINGQINFYYPWKNRLDLMELAPGNDIVPILLGGKNYRIVKISGFSGDYFKKLTTTSKRTNIKVYELPILPVEGKTDKVLDLLNPLNSGTYFFEKSAVKYLLLEFEGKNEGHENVSISISTNKKTFRISQALKVSSKKKEYLNLNVWSYFDYSYLISGLKFKVINDVKDHGVNVLVIPPRALPLIGSITKKSKQGLSEYLKGTEGKFQYYILYFQFYKDLSRVTDKVWQNYFLQWYSEIAQVLKASGIDESKILFYPIDEPEKTDVKYIKYFFEFYKRQGLKNKLFVTVGKPEVFELLEFVDIAQVYTGRPGMLEQLKKIKNIKSETWVYEIRNSGRYTGVESFKNIGVKAYYLNGKGIGVWNYADVDRSVDESMRKNFSHQNKGSWDIPTRLMERNYSLVYRKGNVLYPSLSWKSLCYGMEEYTFLKYYSVKNGVAAADELVNSIVNNKISAKKLEELKFETF